MKIITFGTLKGGVGKSSALFNIAGIIAKKGKKVLAVDADPQGNTTNNFGIDRTTQNFLSLREIFEEEVDPEEVLIKHAIEKLPTLDILPSSIFLTGTEMRLVNQAGREFILYNYIESHIDFFAQYDYILIDTNPSMSVINQNAFVVSDHIILVSDISMNSIEGAELFMALWEDIRKRLRLENNVSGFLINMLDRRIKLSKDFLEHCQNHEEVGKLLFKNYIPMNVKLKESELEATPINIYAPSSNGFIAYTKLTKELEERGIL